MSAGNERDQGRCLVVDDEPSVCGLVADFVADLNLTTVCVHTDKEAYARIEETPEFVALILDINLGTGTTGFDVARFARQAIPGIPVIYISGQASATSFRMFGVTGAAFVAKPFSSDDLLAPLRARLLPAGP